MPRGSRNEESARGCARRAAGRRSIPSASAKSCWSAPGITVETLDLSEVFGRIQKLTDDAAPVKEKLANIGKYVPNGPTPQISLTKMAKFGVVVDEWMQANQLNGTSVQCWTAMQEFFGVVPCTIMSMMSNNLIPSACETDMVGMLAMYALQLASGTPSAIVDWNNNYGDDPDKTVIFHCSNLPKAFFRRRAHGFSGDHRGFGRQGKYVRYRCRPPQVRSDYLLPSFDGRSGGKNSRVRRPGRSDEGQAREFRRLRRGAHPRLQELLNYICRNGYEHHVSVNLSHYGPALADALGNYKGWDVYHHS
jgi:L-fucose isomerase-like protein